MDYRKEQTMKANEAPKKIYLQPSTIKELPHQNIVYTKPLADNSIEYIRTDAFIEKACEWFRRIDYDDTIPPYETTEDFIEGFKKAMAI